LKKKTIRRLRKRWEMGHEEIRLMELAQYRFQWRALILADPDLRILLPGCYKIEYLSALYVCTESVN
jgi:hypothetical protein